MVDVISNVGPVVGHVWLFPLDYTKGSYYNWDQLDQRMDNLSNIIFSLESNYSSTQ